MTPNHDAPRRDPAESWLTRYSRRGFLERGSLSVAGITLGAATRPLLAATKSDPGLTAADLPRGAAPKPVATPHFPTRLHAFVWRNWPLVTPERMARVVGAQPQDIVRCGRAMGLGAPPPISRDLEARSYLTVIRRNWHLLPYAQLLELLAWSPEQLAFTLREDDFLYVKLGNLKPQCEPLRYQPPDEVVLKREREIAVVAGEEFPQAAPAEAEDLFAFVKQLSSEPPAGQGTAVPLTEGLRYCYSYFALYGDPLMDGGADPYPEGLLARLSRAGANGVWLQAVLHKLAPCPWEPARSEGCEQRLKNLGQLVARARKHGVKVFLYLNEPRALPPRFFAAHPELKGVSEGDYAALCTSVPAVQDFLRRAVEGICRAVPDLGGFFTITASENLTNCWSHGQGRSCPRCSQRSPAAVIAEVNRLVVEGIRAAASRAQLIAWDWGWDDGWAGDAIRQLPVEAAFQSVSEWSLPIDRGGVKSTVGEYSISAIGPGPRARRHWKIARERGLKTVAKIQAGCTWELSAVPYIPAVENVARHAENLHREQVTDLMLGWTLGGYPSPNLEVVAETMASGSAEEGMRRVAERRFGPLLAPAALGAWRRFSAAFSEFPYGGHVLYLAPQQLGPANLLWSEPTGYAATMVGFPYDALDSWRGPYPPEVFAQQLEKVADGFDQALTEARSATASAVPAPEYRQAWARELGVAEAAAIHFRSAANQARFVVARRLAAAAKNAEGAQPHRLEMERLLRDEIRLARRLHGIQSRDSRIGFEASNQYFYVPGDLVEKVVNCRELMARLGAPK